MFNQRNNTFLFAAGISIIGWVLYKTIVPTPQEMKERLGMKIIKDDREKNKALMDVMKQQAGIKPDEQKKSS
ncbi:hypothetical protein ScPMuIL_013994 [Solemya velum]